jgi:hypothetical protein
MHLATHPPRRPGNAPGFMLALLSAAALFALTQCKFKPDAVTGVANPDNPSSCVQQCNRDAKAKRDAENDLHKANETACHDDPVCLANEEARHEAVLDQIAAEQQQCNAGCHRQGGGGND